MQRSNQERQDRLRRIMNETTREVLVRPTEQIRQSEQQPEQTTTGPSVRELVRTNNRAQVYRGEDGKPYRIGTKNNTITIDKNNENDVIISGTGDVSTLVQNIITRSDIGYEIDNVDNIAYLIVYPIGPVTQETTTGVLTTTALVNGTDTTVSTTVPTTQNTPEPQNTQSDVQFAVIDNSRTLPDLTDTFTNREKFTGENQYVIILEPGLTQLQIDVILNSIGENGTFEVIDVKKRNEMMRRIIGYFILGIVVFVIIVIFVLFVLYYYKKINVSRTASNINTPVLTVTPNFNE